MEKAPRYDRRLPSRGFTLIELLVVVAIISLLVAILLPSLAKARAQARRVACASNLRQMALASATYESSYGSLPPGYIATVPFNDADHDTSLGWGWGALLLPFVGQDAVYGKLNLALPIENAQNAAGVQTQIKLFICGADIIPAQTFTIKDEGGSALATVAPSSYAACVGGDESDVTEQTGLGAMYRNSHVRTSSITDGPSNTILLGERAWSNANGTWCGAVNGGVCQRGATNPNPGNSTLEAAGLVLGHAHLNNCNNDTDGGLDDFSSNHPGGSNFAYADGSVHFLRSIYGDNPDGSYTHDSLVFQAMGTIANGDGTGDLGN